MKNKNFEDAYWKLRNGKLTGWRGQICDLYNNYFYWEPSQDEVDFIIEKGKGCGSGNWDTDADMDYKKVKDESGNILKIERTRHPSGGMMESIQSPDINDICWDIDLKFTAEKEKELVGKMSQSIRIAEKFKKDLAQAAENGEFKEFEFIIDGKRKHRP